jgi:hypothetical protein
MGEGKPFEVEFGFGNIFGQSSPKEEVVSGNRSRPVMPGDDWLSDAIVTEVTDEIESDTSVPAPTQSPESSSSDSELVCEVCGVPLVYAGRGRKPKFCEDHKPGKTRTSGTSRKTPKREPRIERLQSDLSENVRLLGAIVGPAAPVTGYVIVDDSDRFAKAICRLAEGRPEVLKALEKASDVAPWVEVGKTFIKIFVAVGVDLNRISPDHISAQTLGVTEAYIKIYPEASEGEQGMEFVPPPPALSLIPR